METGSSVSHTVHGLWRRALNDTQGSKWHDCDRIHSVWHGRGHDKITNPQISLIKPDRRGQWVRGGSWWEIYWKMLLYVGIASLLWQHFQIFRICLFEDLKKFKEWFYGIHFNRKRIQKWFCIIFRYRHWYPKQENVCSISLQSFYLFEGGQNSRKHRKVPLRLHVGRKERYYNKLHICMIAICEIYTGDMIWTCSPELLDNEIPSTITWLFRVWDRLSLRVSAQGAVDCQIDPSWWTHRAISCFSQCSTTGVTKIGIIILSVRYTPTYC